MAPILTEAEAVTALVEALDRSRSTRATPALSILARPRYPLRELRPETLPGGSSVMLSISKWGWHYKRKTPRPSKTPPPADTDAIRAALNAALSPGLSITAAVDHGEYITIVEEKR